MRRLIKSILPLGARSRLKHLGAGALDVISPIAEPRVPPRRDTLIGGGDFIAVGEAFFDVQKAHGLTPDMDILDVGCGQGRMARPLVGWLNGQYHGFDIDPNMIAWCQREYADVPNFGFTHANILNARYNPNGRVAAQDFVFPYTDNSFDRIILTSVFTHMFAGDIERYLSEIARTLRPDGTALISWFLWDDTPQNPRLNFKYKVDPVTRTTLAQNPEAALAFDEDWVRAAYARSGLDIISITRGNWRDRAVRGGLQDLVIARPVRP